MSIEDEKARLRRAMRAGRRAIGVAERERAAWQLADHVMAAASELGIAPGVVVAAYWPMGGEIDPRPLLSRLVEAGAVLVLPTVNAEEGLLHFHRWRPGDALASGFHRTMAPLPGTPRMSPRVVCLPLVAFDGEGRRLGQGGGYYDRTLALLRRDGAVGTVGLAFACQAVERVPDSEHDIRLDWVVTEAGPQRMMPS